MSILRRDFLVKSTLSTLTITSMVGCGRHAKKTSSLYPQNKNCAVTFSIDDGFWKSAEKYMVLFDQYEMKGTFHLVTDWIEPMQSEIGDSYNQDVSHGTWDDWKTVVSAGHEIASHSRTHPALPKIPKEEAEREIVESQQIIQTNLNINETLSFGYPYNQSSPEIRELVSKHYIAAREGTRTGEINQPDLIDFSAIRSWWPLSHTTLDEIIQKIEEAKQMNGWLVIGLHGIDDEGWHPIKYEKLEKVLEYLSKDKQVHVGTLREVVFWLQQRNAFV
jgi:peptidoglycan/xylan/chitin deacetylase (PgdA/CDA1 family)